tara:strand:+ start:90 stop:797 length:708 start_codon:yes stop_codon:yes gene_type:complete
MDILNQSTRTDVYCDKIKLSSFQQSTETQDKAKQVQTFKNCADLLIAIFDPTASVLSGTELIDYCLKRRLEIATEIDENKAESYDKYKYHKQMKPNLIQTGLQIKNSLSTILYLSDLYRLSPTIYSVSSQTSVLLNQKNHKVCSIVFQNGTFQEVSDPPAFNPGTYENLSEYFVLDLKNLQIYQPYLDPISKYKMNELIEIADKRCISLTINTKKKVKKQLYEDINVYELQKRFR